MTFDWTVNLGQIATMGGICLSIVGAYFKMESKQDERFTAFALKIDGRFEGINLQLTKILEGDVRELRGRLVNLESGQSEWTKTVRERTHNLSDSLQLLVLRVDRLERPKS